MDRRKFLSGAVAAAALPAVAPLVQLAPALATPMPPAASITGAAIMQMQRTGNVLMTADEFAAEALRILRMPNPLYAHLMDDGE